jgi:hypothetical protein
MSEHFPRALTEREAAVLDHLLSVDFPGRDALVAQRDLVEVSGRWDDEPTIELEVPGNAARAEVEEDSPVYVTTSDGRFEVLLLVAYGRLKLIELVDSAGQGMPPELPAPDQLTEPIALGPTAARSWWR